MSKMIRKNLTKIFVIIMGCLLGWSLWQQYQIHEKFEAYNKILEDHNYDQALENSFFREKMVYEIHEEIENWGRETNKGLIDTLNEVQRVTLALINQSIISLNDYKAYKNKLGDIYNSQVRDSSMFLSDKELEKIPSPHSQNILKNKVLDFEKELLSLLNGRIGLGGCNLPHIEIKGIPSNTIVQAGDTLEITLSIALFWSNNVRSFYGPSKIDYFSPSGSIEKKELTQNWAILKIPTKGLLKPYESSADFTYQATAHVPKVIGGYEELLLEGTYTVIR